MDSDDAAVMTETGLLCKFDWYTTVQNATLLDSRRR